MKLRPQNKLYISNDHRAIFYHVVLTCSTCTREMRARYVLNTDACELYRSAHRSMVVTSSNGTQNPVQSW